ncbi:MAG: EI24 domain-containing protein, partial [Candidatus Levyibacteriota bacterium]
VVAAVMIAVLAVATGLVAVAVLAMPVIVRTVASRHFPALAEHDGGTVAGSLANALVAVAIFLPLWLLTLPLLAFPPLYVVASLALNAWLTQRMFRYDALALHARAGEIRTVLRRARGRLFALGLLLSPLSLVPVFNILVLPIYAGIAFAELCLAELVALRGSAPAGSPA